MTKNKKTPSGPKTPKTPKTPEASKPQGGDAEGPEGKEGQDGPENQETGEPEAEAAPDTAPDDAPTDDAPEEEIPLEDQVADLNDKLLRALAEAENVRRRAERDRQDASKYAIANFARDMLAVADNLVRAMENVDEETRKKDKAVDQVMVGLEMTQQEMLATFERFGIKPIEAMDRRFDHNLHEAMFELDDLEKPAGTVVQVLEQGYMLNDRLLRPAKVGVSKGGPQENNKEKAEEQPPPDPAQKDGQTAYEDKGKEPGSQLDEEL